MQFKIEICKYTVVKLICLDIILQHHYIEHILKF